MPISARWGGIGVAVELSYFGVRGGVYFRCLVFRAIRISLRAAGGSVASALLFGWVGQAQLLLECGSVEVSHGDSNSSGLM